LQCGKVLAQEEHAAAPVLGNGKAPSLARPSREPH
jgi:hypothetical protein